MKDYLDYKYLWPPRPDAKIPKESLQMFEKMGYGAQVKKNGTCNIIFAKKGEETIFKMRHGPESDHLSWTPTQFHKEYFENLAENSGWNVYVTELLHSKTPDTKNTIYIFDQIVRDGKLLIGMTFLERQELLLNELVDENSVEEWDKYVLNDKRIWLAKTYTDAFNSLFNHLDTKQDEGLVLKKLDAKLENPIKQKSNNGWQFKCRLPHKNYSF